MVSSDVSDVARGLAARASTLRRALRREVSQGTADRSLWRRQVKALCKAAGITYSGNRDADMARVRAILLRLRAEAVERSIERIEAEERGAGEDLPQQP
jgi:hypothetical protein